MSEDIQYSQAMIPEAQSQAEFAFQARFDELQQIIPEIAEKREAINASAAFLVNEFQISDEFFADQGRSLVFAAAAERLTHADSDTTEGQAEKAFVYDVVSLVANKYSPVLANISKSIDEERSFLSEEGTEAVYDKYTNRELTDALTERIKTQGLLDGQKKRMGITEDNEDPFEVRVLSIASSTEDADGLSVPYENSDDDADIETKKQKNKAELEFVNAQSDYKQGLVRRGKAMAGELGRDEVFGPAWVVEVNGKRLLCINMPAAEKILTPSLTNGSKVYSADKMKQDFAHISHEYVHTQGHLNVNHEVDFGINLEELRAEEFSGNLQGYTDIKRFFHDYAIITGQNVREVMNGKPKGGTIPEVYGAIANQVGLSHMLEVVMAAPDAYVQDQSSTFFRNAHTYIGGFDGVLSRILKQEKATGDTEKLEQRITDRAKHLGTIINDENDWLWNYFRRMGLNVVTDLVNKRAEELGLKQPD